MTSKMFPLSVVSLKFEKSQVALKGNVQFVQKVTFEPLMDFKQNHYESCKYYKSY